MKKILLLIGLILGQLSAYAGLTVRGRIVDDSNGMPLIGATATMLDNNDNIVMGIATDVEGRFTLKGVNNGSCVMLFQYLGYNDERIEITNLDRDVDMGDIRLTVSTVSLDEVVVSGDAVIKRSDRQMILQ